MIPSPKNLKCTELRDEKYKELCSALAKKNFDKKFYFSIAEYYFPELQKYFAPYKVKLNPDGFTSDKNIDTLILNKLNDEDLSNVCLINKYVYSLCQDDNFWMKRFLERYGKYYDNIEEIEGFKSNASWKEYYLWLTDIIENPNSYYMFAHALHLHRKDVTRILYEMKNIYVEKLDIENGEQKGTFLYVKIPFDINDIGKMSIKEFEEKILPLLLPNIDVDENRVGPFRIYIQGVLIQEGNSSGYGKNKYEGEYKEFFPNGALKKKVFFINGTIDGDFIEYYTNGQISTLTKFENGIVKHEEAYLMNGKRIK